MKPVRTILALAILFTSGIVLAEDKAAEHSLRPRIMAHRGASTERPECTLAALRRAVEVGADIVEIDVRTSKDGVLFLLHDATLDRTTDGSGPGGLRTMAELKKLDAGSWFGAAYRGERVPTLAEAIKACRGRIDVLLDLKEQGAAYAKAVADDVKTHGDEARTIIGVRSVEQARLFRRLLPRSPQLGLIASPKDIAAYAAVGVETIRLWPKWINAADGAATLKLVRKSGAKLHLNGKTGTVREILPFLQHRPHSLIADDPATLKATLDQWQRHSGRFDRMSQLVDVSSGGSVVRWIAGPREPSFLNRGYVMRKLPKSLHNQPRLLFAGGEGHRVAMRFVKPAVVFAVFEYNSTGAWSFPEGRSPAEFGWRLVKKGGYRGTSNGIVKGKPHHADIYCRAFTAGEQLTDLPSWWLCLAVVDAKTAATVPGFTAAMAKKSVSAAPFLYGRWATRDVPLLVPQYQNAKQWSAWQKAMREKFRKRLVFAYDAPTKIVKVGKPTTQGGVAQQEFHVRSKGRRLFRFFKLTPETAASSATTPRRPTIVCFMGHGKVRQLLDEPDSYQHACAARFAKQGYLVFAMENVGMEPGRDTHKELDRLLRLDGYGWYSLLFAHQQILLSHVFTDPMVDRKKVGVTGVSTGGLLALSAIAMEPRVASASVQGIFGSMRVSFIQDRNRHCSCGAIPGLLPNFDLPEMALMAAPRPLHISNPTRDGFGPTEARRSIRRITPHYRRVGGPVPEFSSPTGHHEFAFSPALKFFEKTIGKAK